MAGQGMAVGDAPCKSINLFLGKARMVFEVETRDFSVLRGAAAIADERHRRAASSATHRCKSRKLYIR